jgi:hypothetical protein
VDAPVLRQSPLDRDGALERALGSPKGDEEAIAGVPNLLAIVMREQLAQRLVMPAQEVEPGLVAQSLDERRRLDDVGEDEGTNRTLRRLAVAGDGFERLPKVRVIR